MYAVNRFLILVYLKPFSLLSPFYQVLFKRYTGKMFRNVYSKIPTNILDELSSRFIINVPQRERADIITFCYHIEKSHWFYLDNFCKTNRNLLRFSFEKFAAQLFHHVPFLSIHLRDLNQILEEFQMYKSRVPTYGAILLSENLMYVLLVQSFCSKSLWGFPKGKIEVNEEPHHCAIREVQEETSYDISPFIKHNWYVEGEWKNSSSTGFTGLYIIPNVPMETEFKSKTEGEIRFFKWFRLSDLFVAKNGLYVETTVKITANTFYMKNQLQRFLIENKLKILEK